RGVRSSAERASGAPRARVSAPRARVSAFTRARARWEAQAGPGAASPEAVRGAPPLTAAQRSVLAGWSAAAGHAVHLLHGITGSGKTEVDLHWYAGVPVAGPDAKVLQPVPGVGLAPQVQGQLTAGCAHERVALLHSEMADGERAAHWLAAVGGRARVVRGTRLAVLAPLPALAAIVVDEEHDASYKQQEGVRYSARDLAIVAAAQRKVPIVRAEERRVGKQG